MHVKKTGFSRTNNRADSLPFTSLLLIAGVALAPLIVLRKCDRSRKTIHVTRGIPSSSL